MIFVFLFIRQSILCCFNRKSTQIASLSLEMAERMAQLAEHESVDLEFLSSVEQIFKSLPCMNASFLTKDNTHSGCSSRNPGVSIEQSETIFQNISRIENRSLKQIVSNTSNDCFHSLPNPPHSIIHSRYGKASPTIWSNPWSPHRPMLKCFVFTWPFPFIMSSWTRRILRNSIRPSSMQWWACAMSHYELYPIGGPTNQSNTSSAWWRSSKAWSWLVDQSNFAHSWHSLVFFAKFIGCSIS